MSCLTGAACSRVDPPAASARRRPPRFLFVLALLAIALGLGTGCQPKSSDVLQGYIEGEFVNMAAPLAGTLQERPVERGRTVQKGDLLFRLDPEPESAAVVEATERQAQAGARLANLRKGARPSELGAIEARLAQARAMQGLWESELARREKLLSERVISQQEWDQTIRQRDAAKAQVEALASELETARLGGREDEVKAAEAEVQASGAALSRARWALDQKTVHSPAAAVVHDTLYRVGEHVAAGRPVVSLLPPENIKVRFYVPEPRLAAVRVGGRAEVLRDGVAVPLPATIAYVSTQAEFTPPVIYSRQTRAKLVYMVEATFDPDAARTLHPGQPVDVRLVP